MITFITTTSKLILTSSNTTPLDVVSSANLVNVTADTFVPVTKNLKVVSAIDTDITDAPGASEAVQLKFTSVTNIDPALSAVVSYSKSVSATKYKLTPDVTLLPGETLAYLNAGGWIYYSATGAIKAQQTAAGSNTWIQFNNNGILAGDADFTFDNTTNTLGLNGTDAGFRFQAITNEPGAQSAGLLRVYAKTFCGKQMLKQVGSAGADTPLQNAVWQNNKVIYTPGAAAGVWDGTVGANLGVPTIVLPTTTNLATMLRRSNFPTVVTTANQQVGTRSEAIFYRGNAAGLGGFFFACRFMFTKWTTTNRLFVGLAVGTTAMVTADASGLLNLLGFGVDTADTAITFMHNDGSGTATKETIAGQPALATNNGYAAYIFCKPNDSTVYFRLDNLLTGAVIIDSSVNTDLPVNTTALIAHAAISNGPTNVVAGDAAIGINRIYIETDI